MADRDRMPPDAGDERAEQGERLTPPSGVTIYEVAARAGVSIATVSRALRGSGPVSAKARERVEAAVAELRFTPSRLGRSLAERRHAANGIVFPDLSGPYFAEVVLGYEEVAAEAGRSVLILSTHGRRDVPAMVRDLASRVDGMVILGRTVSDAVIGELIEGGLPVVLLARPRVNGADLVAAENTASAEHLTEHLLLHGYSRLSFVGSPQLSPDVAERWLGFRRALDRHGVRAGKPVACELDEESGFAATERILRRRDRPRALVCGNDEVALGALLAAEANGVDVPGELAMTGWDDVMAARYARPALTTVRQPMRDLGARAARALDELLEGTRKVPRHDVLPTELVVRASCGTHPTEVSR
ncbi:LacI family DNA-binding transcriptional regulator [Fodinicola acaciae]|uniref:LacI family DNA-binding transcriptional regulator n=1 Tax=Fodinicola acaciae TaxID=2681555 RepID=UPI001C9E9A62|nr:LacI family DNA-binding transcriptional regulator [Fodinicola acaciae]